MRESMVSMKVLIYYFICWNYAWKMHLCKYMCLVDMVMQIYLITIWLGLDKAELKPVLSQNGFRQRFAKPPLELMHRSMDPILNFGKEGTAQ